MSIFTRFRDIIHANLNAMLEGAEDPEKMIRLIIQEMEETSIELKAACASTMAARKTTARSLDEVNARAAEWERRARLAVEKGREDLAREALHQKRQHVDAAAATQREADGLDAIIAKYRDEITQLEEKLNGAREKQRLLTRRHLQAQQRTRAQQQIRQANAQETIARFERFEQKVDRMEAEADLVNYGRRPSLEEDFAQLERGEEIEAELRALKQSVGNPQASQNA